MGTREGWRQAGRGWNWGRTGRGWRCGTAEQRVVQEDGAGAKMSVQVKLFIALHHGPFYQALITTSIIPLFPLSSYAAHIQEKAETHLPLNHVISVYSQDDITFYTLYVKNITDKDVALLSLRCQTFYLTDLTTAIQAVIAIYTLSTEASDTVTNQAEQRENSQVSLQQHLQSFDLCLT